MPLSAALANDPAIRALSLRPYRVSDGHYQIVGRLGTYDLTITKDGALCSCLAAKSGRVCAHSLAAVRQYIADRRSSLMRIASERPTGSDTYDHKQPIRLSRGLYGGLLQRYSAPKEYKKFDSNEMETKFFVSFLITHDAGARPLPKPTSAFCGVRTKRFFDSTKDIATTMVRLYDALLNGKMSTAEIADCDDEQLPDLDELIGYPAMIAIKPALKADKNGIFPNQIDTQANGGFLRPDKAMRAAAAKIYTSADMKYSDKGLRYLASPAEEFEEDGDSALVGSESLDSIEDDDQIPF
jgi:hypothetical protein